MQLISYAQNFEDIMLWRALGQIERGFYIDVGAGAAGSDSVTRLFSERGWRGLNIEPNEELFAKLVERRPNEINLNLAVGAREHLPTINFVQDDGSDLPTMRDSYSNLHKAQGWETQRGMVSKSTLRTVWSKHVPPCHDVHFLKIDVEGNAKGVLEGNDWTRNRPWVVLLKARLPNPQIECHHESESILLDADYAFAYSDKLNRFYVSKERADLLRAFAYPPNVLAKFISAETDNLRAAVERSEVRIRHIEVANASLETQVKDAESANARLETRITWLRHDRDLLEKALTEERTRREATILDLLRRHQEIVAYRTPRLRKLAQLIALGGRMRRRRRHLRAIEMIRLSIFFDPIWYQREYPDIAATFPDSASHYYHHGAAEGCDPGPYFSTRQYLEANALPPGTNPIVHYALNHAHRPA